MTSKPDFVARLAKRVPVAEPEPEIKEPAPRSSGRKSVSRVGMKLLSSWVPIETWEWFRIVSVKERTTMDALQAEAFAEFMAKRSAK